MLSAEALRELFWCDPRYNIVTLLASGGLSGRRVEFKRCDGCGNDGRLYVDGVFVMNSHSHQSWRLVLPNLQQALDSATYTLIRRGIHAATWMAGYEPVPGMLALASRADVAQYGRGRDDLQEAVNGLLDIVFRVGGDDR